MAGGRPTRMTEHFDVVEVEDQPPRARTVADAILDLLRIGNYLETACWVVGVAPRTVRTWLADGNRALDRLDAGLSRRQLTAQQRRCVEFLQAVRAAQAEAEDRDVQRLDRLARGGIPILKTVEKWEYYLDDDGQEQRRLVERQVTATRSLPDARAITWRLERKFPDRWGRLPTVDETEGEDDDEFGGDPLDTVRGMLEGISRRNREVLAELAAGGHEDILDAEIVDERPPEIRDGP